MAQGVTVDFTANMVKFQGQVDKAMESLDKFRAKSENIGQKIDRSLSAIGVGLSAAGIAAFVKSGIDAADALNDMADRTGIAVEKLAGFQLATKLADTDMQAFAAAANKLSVNIGKNAEDFAKLGITAKDPAEAFMQLADVFSSIEDPQQRAALGAAALGKSYAEMAPLLMQGGEALRQQVEQGQKMTGITTEQAKAAADLNDKLDTLTRSFASLTSVVVGPLIPGMAQFVQSLEYAVKVTDSFNPGKIFEALAAGSDYQVAINRLQKVNQDIAGTKEAIDKLRGAGIGETFVKSVFMDETLGGLENELRGLTQQRQKLLTDFQRQNAEVKQKSESSAGPATSAAAVQDFIGKNNAVETAARKVASASSAAGKAESGRADSIRKLVENLQFEIDLTGRSAETQKVLSDIRSSTANATAAEAAAIEKLIRTKYDLIEADDILAEGERLAAKQRSESASEYERLDQRFNAKLRDLNSGISDATQARAMGIIPDDAKLKEVLDKMGKDYNGLSDNANQATDQMSEYAVQAARNMESAFADFLFDPFDKGLDGLASSFAKTMAKMATNAASAQIFDGFKSKDSGGGGWGSAIGSGISSIFSSLFHDGGVVGAGGSSISVHPSVFSDAPRLHNGGYLKPDEVPAILQTGEMVLSRRQVASMGGGSGDVQISTMVNVSGGNGNSDNMATLGGIINARVREVITTEKRPGGLLA